MAFEYAPLPSQEGTELRRRSAVADGVGVGFSLYTVSNEPPLSSEWSLRAFLRRILAVVRSRYVVAFIGLLILTGAILFYSIARKALDEDIETKAVNHVRCRNFPPSFLSTFFANFRR
jgi:uncharacterized membrane protein YedE/YeeE